MEHLLVALQIITLMSLGTVRPGQSDGAFRFINNCQNTVWIGAQSSAGIQPLAMSEVQLLNGNQITVTTSASWGGRFWGRTGCTFGANGLGSCVTGDCDGKLQCQGTGGKTPATLAEVTLSGADGKDFYDISLVDGYNLPLAMSPTNGGQGRNETDPRSCGAAGCTGDLNQNCPADLRVMAADQGSVVGCKSACEAFQSSQYCCSGSNNLPSTCPATDYSKTFKQSCPKAYSYAYDDVSSLFTCRGGQYTITFCPTALSDGVQFPEAQAVPTTVPTTSSNDGSIGTNFRIITPSRGELATSISWWLLATIAASQALAFSQY